MNTKLTRPIYLVEQRLVCVMNRSLLMDTDKFERGNITTALLENSTYLLFKYRYTTQKLYNQFRKCTRVIQYIDLLV